MDDFAVLEEKVRVAQEDLRNAKDRLFCDPDNVRSSLMAIAKALGGINKNDTLTLHELHEEVLRIAKQTNDAYQSSLWPKGRGC